MIEGEFLTLRLIRLKAPEEWPVAANRLSFVFCKGGAGKYVSGTAIRPLASGDVLVQDGASGGKLCAADRGEMIFWSFSACLEHLFPLLAGTEISLLQDITADLRAARFYPASTPLARQCHRLLEEVPPQSDLNHRGQLLRVVAAIISEEFKAVHSRRIGFVRPEEHMMQVFEKLSTDEILSLSVAELAGKFGCSRRHLNRLFHQHFGFSVAALRMEMRLLKAVSLLRNPDAKVINVADECGFNHLGLFNTCFKRRFGASPGQYRKLGVPAATQPSGPGGAESACPLHANGLCPLTGGPGSVQPMPQAASAQQKAPAPTAPTNPKPAPERAGPHPPAAQQKIPAHPSRHTAPREAA